MFLCFCICNFALFLIVELFFYVSFFFFFFNVTATTEIYTYLHTLSLHDALPIYITYHGPGQIVGYPILDLDHFFTDIHRYLRTLEEAVILTLGEYGIEAGRIPDLTGVWIDPDTPQKARKICALGVRCSRWVTMHGFAFNVNVDTGYFNHIIPCGIDDKQFTSLHMELGKTPDVLETWELLKSKIAGLFEMTFTRNTNSEAPA